MEDLIIIGSPRGKGSNSLFLAKIFIDGFRSQKEWSPDIIFLSQQNKLSQHIEQFKNTSRVLWFMPLYTDAMPAIVKHFIEQLKPEDISGKEMGFMIQSGFPEAFHSVFVERYFKEFTEKNGASLIGSMIKGGVEGIQIQPAAFTKKLKRNMFNQGAHFAQYGNFDPKITDGMRKNLHLKKSTIFFLRILNKLGLTNQYWNMNLKKNKAFDKRFDKPYSN